MMPKYLKVLSLAVLAILAITGILATLVQVKIWEVTPSIRTNIIRIHVSWSVISCIVVGMVIEGHVRKTIKYKSSSKKKVGILFLAMFFLVMFASFIIRHIKISKIYDAAITVHWILGLALIMLFLLHYFLGKKT